MLSDPPPDRIFEVSEHALSAAASRAPQQQQSQALPERGLSASPSAPNILKPQLYRGALEKLTMGNGKRLTAALVIPDYAVRMAILDFENFPATEQEQSALIRFRLRKSVPFHIEEAQVSFAIQLQQERYVEVLTVAIAHPILQQYEAIFHDAGYRLGMVVPSVVASLPLCKSTQKGLTLLAKSVGYTLSVVLLEQGRVRLVRCLDLGSEEYAAAQRGAAAVMPLMQQTMAFAEDQLGDQVSRVLLCGFEMETETLGSLVTRDFGVPYEPVKSRFGAAVPENAGLLGLLEQYAA